MPFLLLFVLAAGAVVSAFCFCVVCYVAGVVPRLLLPNFLRACASKLAVHSSASNENITMMFFM